MARTIAYVPPEVQEALDAVTQARTAYLEAEAAYRAACVSAHEAGANFNAIGRAADITPQSARQIVLRATTE